ncbi:MAG: L-fuculose phosphate aldolase [Phycisphaerae bacterium]|nr:L-fuculose phosphate aldolase [Phycisphaerae bacterium]
MAGEWQLKQQICDVGRRMYERGFVAANDGNISVRIGPNRFLCTPTGVSKGTLVPGDIGVVDIEGNQIAGSKPRTSEIRMHLAIYKERTDINAVCHAHPPHATAFAVAGVDIPNCILPEVEVFIGQVPIARYETPGTWDFAETILPYVRNKANTILLANHGAVSCDRTLEQAYFHLETVDMYCQILLLSKQVGSINQISDEKVRELLGLKKRLGIADPRLDCMESAEQCKVCTLSGSDEFLKGFSQRAIPQHTADADGHGRGRGIAEAPSQAGQPQPIAAAPAAAFPAVVAGRALGSSSTTARQREMNDQIERLVQLITDRIVGMTGK